jgi:hypothetical protein
VALLLPYPANAVSSHHLTAGFSHVKLSESHFVVQKPYDVPLHERYEQSGGVRRMWVFDTDKPISTTRPGYPRTEIKVDVPHADLEGVMPWPRPRGGGWH